MCVFVLFDSISGVSPTLTPSSAGFFGLSCPRPPHKSFVLAGTSPRAGLWFVFVCASVCAGLFYLNFHLICYLFTWNTPMCDDNGGDIWQHSQPATIAIVCLSTRQFRSRGRASLERHMTTHTWTDCCSWPLFWQLCLIAVLTQTAIPWRESGVWWNKPHSTRFENLTKGLNGGWFG